jgi:hypothetical protein
MTGLGLRVEDTRRLRLGKARRDNTTTKGLQSNPPASPEGEADGGQVDP